MLMPSRRSLVRVVPPASEPLTLLETKAYLRVEGSAEDTLIASLITAARHYAETHLRKSLVSQRWKVAFADYAPERVWLPRGPVREMVEVTRIFLSGETETLDPARYRLESGGDTVYFDGSVYAQSIEMTYETGYGQAADVPKPICYGMLAHIASLYERRGDAQVALPGQSAALYAPFREVAL